VVGIFFTFLSNLNFYLLLLIFFSDLCARSAHNLLRVILHFAAFVFFPVFSFGDPHASFVSPLFPRRLLSCDCAAFFSFRRLRADMRSPWQLFRCRASEHGTIRRDNGLRRRLRLTRRNDHPPCWVASSVRSL
jgi:hypothetical protein